MPLSRPDALRDELRIALPDRPFRVEFWDGAVLEPSDGVAGPTFHVRSPAAVGHLLRAPGQLGISRAYVSGLLEPDDLDAALQVVDGWKPPALDRRTKARLAAAAVRAAGLIRPPKPPQAELRERGRRHSIARDRRAVRHHYDVSNEFFRLMLGPSLTYSMAIWSRGATDLEDAQRTKLDIVCAKLCLQEGQRVLDVGCGWGSFALHAAGRYGVHVTGLTLSEPQ